MGSLEQVDEVIAEEKRSKGKLMPVFQYRFGNGIEQAKAIIDAGIAGKPYVGTVETLWRRGPDYYAIPWRGKWKTELGGVLMTHAIHPHDIFTYLMGEPKSLFGRVATRVNDIEVEDCISASVEMQSGALASFTATLGSADEITRIRLAFENVTIESDHAAYNPGAAPWKILPRTDEAKAKIEALLRDWKDVGAALRDADAAVLGCARGQGPDAGDQRGFAPGAGDRHGVLPFVRDARGGELPGDVGAPEIRELAAGGVRVSGFVGHNHGVIPAKAGTSVSVGVESTTNRGSRFRGNDPVGNRLAHAEESH